MTANETLLIQGRQWSAQELKTIWIEVGMTTGRTRNDRGRELHAATKSVWLCPLTSEARERLCV